MMMRIHAAVTYIKTLPSLTKIHNDAIKFSINSRKFSTDAAEGPQALGPPLTDRFGRRHDYLRISLTERCNLRCVYCMPAEGVALTPREELLTSEETLRVARVLAALGVRKVRLTGGEPTLRRDLPALVGALAATPGVRTVGLTTNALALTRRLPALQAAGLSALNVSLDTLRADRFERVTRRAGLPRVLAALDLALQLGVRPLKVNTVLVKGFNDDEILDFVEYTRDRDLEVHRVHAVRGQRVGGGAHGARAGGAQGRAGAPPPHAAAAAGLRHGHRVARGGARGPRGVHLVDDAQLLRRLQPAAAHRRRQPQGVPAGRGGGVAAGRDAGRGGPRARIRRGPRAPRAGRARAQACATRRYGEPRPNEKPSHDTDRRLTRVVAGGYLARRYCTGPRGDGWGDEWGDESGEAGGELTHLDAEGRARMVDVGAKRVTVRAAVAECSLRCSARVLRLVRGARLPKGDALAVAETAGVLAAKRTADLVPLCHALPLTSVRVRVRVPPEGAGEDAALRVRCWARAEARTGVEMEALTGAAVAALALYDMCKAADRHMRITDLRLLRKTGGRSDYPPDPSAPPDPATPSDPRLA